MSSEIDLGGFAESTAGRTARDSLEALPATATVPGPRRPGLPPARGRWETRLGIAAMAGDVGALGVAVLVGHLLNLGSYSPLIGNISPGLGLIAAVITLSCLFSTRAWEPRILGQGSEEFSRVMRAFVISAVLLGLAGLALELAAVRPWVFGLVPLAGLLAMLGRFALRKYLHRRRDSGDCLYTMVAVGDVDAVADLVERTRRDRYNGWEVTAACTPTGSGVGGTAVIAGVPVVGDLDSVAEVVRSGGFRAVAVTAAPGWSQLRLHRLSWDLEGLGSELVVDPGLMEIAGPRLHITPVDGLPLLRLTAPAFTGVSRLVKSIVDRIGALVLIILTAPVLLAIAVAVLLDGGPVLFRQARVGRHGRRFRMLKFRSMVVDAEARLAELAALNEGAGPMFKLRRDPRVTRVGGWLRKYSLDELPQLFNVLAGSMSLVGPRPPLPAEVATYGREARRKLLVKPGLTGLWQVSGRSDLSWEESVRLDLRYVENWTLALDALIVWKTFGALVRGGGAY